MLNLEILLSNIINTIKNIFCTECNRYYFDFTTKTSKN